MCIRDSVDDREGFKLLMGAVNERPAGGEGRMVDMRTDFRNGTGSWRICKLAGRLSAQPLVWDAEWVNGAVSDGERFDRSPEPIGGECIGICDGNSDSLPDGVLEGYFAGTSGFGDADGRGDTTGEANGRCLGSVSYTHLTLPTKRIV